MVLVVAGSQNRLAQNVGWSNNLCPGKPPKTCNLQGRKGPSFCPAFQHAVRANPQTVCARQHRGAMSYVFRVQSLLRSSNACSASSLLAERIACLPGRSHLLRRVPIPDDTDAFCTRLGNPDLSLATKHLTHLGIPQRSLGKVSKVSVTGSNRTTALAPTPKAIPCLPSPPTPRTCAARRPGVSIPAKTSRMDQIR
jgi:hypothetical protein